MGHPVYLAIEFFNDLEAFRIFFHLQYFLQQLGIGFYTGYRCSKLMTGYANELFLLVLEPFTFGNIYHYAYHPVRRSLVIVKCPAKDSDPVYTAIGVLRAHFHGKILTGFNRLLQRTGNMFTVAG